MITALMVIEAYLMAVTHYLLRFEYPNTIISNAKQLWICWISQTFYSLSFPLLHIFHGKKKDFLLNTFDLNCFAHFSNRKLHRKYAYWRERGIPSPPVVPLFGNLLSVSKSSQMAHLDFIKKYGKVYGLV